MRLYLDTSAYAKRYLGEPGALRVMDLLGQADEIILSSLTLLEMVSALSRYVKDASLHRDDYTLFKKQLLRDLGTMEIISISEDIISETLPCIERGAFRALDAIHLATAKRADCDLFLTADQRQYQMAVSLGIKAELAI